MVIICTKLGLLHMVGKNQHNEKPFLYILHLSVITKGVWNIEFLLKYSYCLCSLAGVTKL